MRPHAARRAANWFIANFPGRVLYAAKANDAPEIIEALVKAGIRAFDVASLVEIERLAPDRGCRVVLHEPGQVAGAIVRAYREYGVQELRLRQLRRARQDRRMRQAGAEDLDLYLRVACPNTHSLIPLEGKFGASAQLRRHCCSARARSRGGSASPSMSALKRLSPPRSARRFARSAS